MNMVKSIARLDKTIGVIMSKILTVCPSIYPDKLIKMEKSFYDTITEDNTLYVVSFGTVTEAINFAFNKYPDYDYYHITNDDVIYETKGWDKILSNKLRISYGNDCIQKENLCTFPLIDGDIVRALGWLQMPELDRYCGDVIWKFLGDRLNILSYHENVIIRHVWEGQDNAINIKDMGNFSKWLPWSFKDVEKINKIL